jgi:hypothetical protein
VEARRVAGEAVQVLEAAPVLHHHRAAVEQAGVGAEQPLAGVVVKVAQHPRHPDVDRPPLLDLPRPVEPHADEEDDEVAVELRRVPAKVAPGHCVLPDVRTIPAADARRASCADRERIVSARAGAALTVGWKPSRSARHEPMERDACR